MRSMQGVGRYGMQGFASCAVVNDVLSINVSRHPSCLVQAVRGADGTLLWSYQVKERLSAAPVVADGVVYVSLY